MWSLLQNCNYVIVVRSQNTDGNVFSTLQESEDKFE